LWHRGRFTPYATRTVPLVYPRTVPLVWSIPLDNPTIWYYYDNKLYENVLFYPMGVSSMLNQNKEFIGIMKKFAESEWDVIDGISRAFLDAVEEEEIVDDDFLMELQEAIEEADRVCGSCGCEYDPLYKRALELIGDFT
jgi:hypothetical protein